MSEFADAGAFRTFRAKHWSEKSGWRLRVKLRAGDSEQIALKTTAQGLDLAKMSDGDRAKMTAYLKAMQAGEEPDIPDVEIEAEAHHTAAMALVMTVSTGRWWGPDLCAPEGGLWLKQGSIIDPEDEAALHGAAHIPEGELLPCDESTIALIGDDTFDELTTGLSKQM